MLIIKMIDKNNKKLKHKRIKMCRLKKKHNNQTNKQSLVHGSPQWSRHSVAHVRRHDNRPPRARLSMKWGRTRNSCLLLVKKKWESPPIITVTMEFISLRESG
jgi:hypothetical protein